MQKTPHIFSQTCHVRKRPSIGEKDRVITRIDSTERSMTPTKSKRPLPSAKSTSFSERPSSALEWTYALQRVKGLYFQAQYKQCSILCQRLLLELDSIPHPLHSTCLHFYSALANEAIARGAHNLSTSKLQTLRCAKVSYQDALRSMPKPKPIPMDQATVSTEPALGIRPRLLKAPTMKRPNSNRPDSDILGARYDESMNTDDEYYDENEDVEDSSGDSTPTAESHSDSPRCPSSQSSVESFHDARETEQETKKRLSRTASTISATSMQLQLLSSRTSGSAIYFGCNIDDGAQTDDEGKLTPHPLRVSKTPAMHVSSPSTSSSATATQLSNLTDSPPSINHGTGFRLSRPTSVYYPSNPFSLSRASSVSRKPHSTATAFAPPSASDLALLPSAPTTTTVTSPEAQAIMRFNTHLYAFKDILYSHIEDINTAITSTEDVQRERKEKLLLLQQQGGAKKKCVVFEDDCDDETGEMRKRAGDDEDEGDAVKRRRRERIERLRGKGWKVERFWAKRYQRVAERALAEVWGGRGVEQGEEVREGWAAEAA